MVFCSFSVFSQGKLLTVDDAAIGQYRQFSPQMLYQLKWMPGSDIYTYFKKKGEMLACSVKSGKESVLFTTQELNTLLSSKELNPVAAFPYYEWVSQNVIRIQIPEGIMCVNIKDKKVENLYRLKEEADNIDFCSASGCIAYTIANNLYVMNSKAENKALSSDPDTGIVTGKAVHRNEFGIEKGTFWSESGKNLAFYRMDESMVTNYPLVDIEPRIAEVNPIRYPMAGMTSHQVTVGIYSVETGKTIFLKTGEPKEQYLTNISWSADDKYVFIAVLNREQNHMKFNQYNAETGDFMKTLFEEKNDRYVEPLHPAVFLKKKPGEFIWQSQADGFNHLYLYDANGKVIRQLTKGEWVVTDFLGFNQDESVVYFLSTEKSPLERHLYAVNMESGKKQCLTSQQGYHSAIIASSGNYVLDNYSSQGIVNNYDLLDVNGKKIREIYSSSDPLKDIAMPEMKFIKIKSADGKTDLYGRIIKPLNLDTTKKYPAIVYVYGGPHAQLVENSWLGGAPLWDYYMAQKGYVVITVDNRGSANRGFAFESVIHRNCGEAEAFDQMEAVKYLKGLGYVDEKRIGVHGWSYGGFMTLNLMTTFPEVFKTGVAGGPVIDWKYYEIMYGERYMDTPQENPEGYEKTSLIKKAHNLKGKALIIHGYIDDTVVLQHSLSFLQECIKNNILVDYFVFPEHQHNVRGMDRIYLMKKITQYFDDNL